MNYLSTRGGMPPRPFTEILLGGLGPDGGLVVPERIPQIDAATLASWRGLPYPDVAFRSLRRDCDYGPAEALRAVAEERGADRIVVGNKGMTGATRFLLGSVPNKISHHAPCGVLIIRTV